MSATQQDVLAQGIAEMTEGLSGQVPADVLAPFAADQVRMEAEGLAGGGPQLGEPLPDGDLLDVHGAPTTLTTARGGKPAVVVFYRGAWCPYCNVALRTYEQALVPALTAQGVGLIAISPQKPDGAMTMQQTNALSYTVLSDPGNQIAGALGILTAHSDESVASQRALGIEMAAGNGDGTGTIPMPTVALLDAQGVLRWVDVHVNYATRTEPAAVLAALATLPG